MIFNLVSSHYCNMTARYSIVAHWIEELHLWGIKECCSRNFCWYGERTSKGRLSPVLKNIIYWKVPLVKRTSGTTNRSVLPIKWLNSFKHFELFIEGLLKSLRRARSWGCKRKKSWRRCCLCVLEKHWKPEGKSLKCSRQLFDIFLQPLATS